MNEIIDVFYYLFFFFLTEPEREAGRGSLLRETKNSLSLARLGGEDGKARRSVCHLSSQRRKPQGTWTGWAQGP